MFCFELGSDISNKVSDVRAEFKKIGVATGTWKNIGVSTTDNSFDVKWGIKSDQSADT